jgi:hypothetical protein
MVQYLLNFHHFPFPADAKPTAEEFEAVNKQWQGYIGGIVAQGKFVGTQRLGQAGSIISPMGAVTDVVAEGKGLIVGTLTLQADSLEEAIELAKGCPVLAMGGSVEVRPILPFDI